MHPHLLTHMASLKTNKQNPQNPLNVISLIDSEKTELKAAVQLSGVILSRPVFAVFIQLLYH